MTIWRKLVGVLLGVMSVGGLLTVTASPASAAVQCNGTYVASVEYYATPLGTKVSMQPTRYARLWGEFSNAGMWDELSRCTPIPWRNFMLSWNGPQIASAWDQMRCHNAYAWWYPGTYDYEQWRPQVSWPVLVATMCNP